MTSQRLIQEAKNFLRSGTPIPDEAVRPEILRSWKRCWGSHVPMEHGNKEILPLDAVEERIARRNSLCQVAFPYLDGLYDFIRGSEFLLLFSDEEGYILYARGDEDISRTARETFFLTKCAGSSMLVIKERRDPYDFIRQRDSKASGKGDSHRAL